MKSKKIIKKMFNACLEHNKDQEYKIYLEALKKNLQKHEKNISAGRLGVIH